MSRILLLLIFLLWMAGGETSGAQLVLRGNAWAATVVYLGSYALLVLGMRAWSSVLAHKVTLDNFERKHLWYNKVMFAARILVPGWLGFGLYVLGWGAIIQSLFPETRIPEALREIRLPATVLGTLPSFAAWVGLWWAQYPADHALREQNILFQVESGMPVFKPPGVGSYIVSNLRLQVLFTIVPILLILAVRDAAAAVYLAIAGHEPGQTIDMTISIGSAALIFLVAPEILRRVLHTQPLPMSPLRRRLEDMCRRTGMRYRDILLWRTQNNMGNAAVMGVLPRVRYVLLSDLLLERMDDEQIEAVFAHEVGHVVHRHMAWFVLFFVVFFAGVAALGSIFGSVVADAANRFHVGSPTVDLVTVLGAAAAFLVLFGFLSRRFERQADVYAARTMEASRAAKEAESAAELEPAVVFASGGGGVAVMEAPPRVRVRRVPRHTSHHVGRYGATLFASALHRVAVINNIPVTCDRRHRRLALTARRSLRRRIGFLLDDAVEAMHNWFHGSIAHRMAYVRDLSADPALTGRFDRFMLRLYCTLLVALAVSAAACAMTWKA